MGQVQVYCPCGGAKHRLIAGSAELDRRKEDSPQKHLQVTDVNSALERYRWHLSDWPPLLPRHVHPLPGHVMPGPSGLRVMSFNLLADGKQGQEQWECTAPDALAWDFRKWRLLEELVVHRPDVLLLQEVDAVFFDDFFLVHLSQVGYAGHFRQMPDSRPDGVAILWSSHRLRMIKYEDFELSAASEVASAALLETIVDCSEPLCAKARQIAVACTHLNSGKDPASESVREAQVRELLDRLRKFAAGVPVVLGADFNAEPIKAAKTGPPLALPAALAHDLGLQTAYEEPRYTTWKKRPKGEIRRVIDYILFTERLLKLVALLDLPADADMPEERLPCHAYPSDHIALMAVFNFL